MNPDFIRKKFNGSVTVLLALVLSIICALMAVLIKSAVIDTCKNESRMIANAAMDSMFSEFDKELLEKYHIMFFNGEYESSFSEQNLIDRFGYYASNGYEDATRKVMFESGMIEGIEFITDHGCRTYKDQTIEYMKSKYGITFLEKLGAYTGMYDTLGKNSTVWENTVKDNENERKLLEEEVETDRLETEEAPDITDPVAAVDEYRSYDVLNLMCPGLSISDNSVNKESLLSGRTLRRGYGDVRTDDAQKNVFSSVTRALVFDEYILDSFDNALSDSTDQGGLRYQVEYIISGKNSDRANLRSVINKLLLLREGCNLVYLLSDSSKMEEAYELAAALVGYLAVPGLVELTQFAIIIAWAFAESVVDVRTLMKGGKIPLFKSESSWKLSLDSVADLGSADGDSKDDSTGTDYKGYLRYLLYIQNQDTSTIRSLDMIEDHLRQKSNDPSIKLDDFVAKLKLKAQFSVSSYSYSFPVYYGYN